MREEVVALAELGFERRELSARGGEVGAGLRVELREVGCVGLGVGEDAREVRGFVEFLVGEGLRGADDSGELGNFRGEGVAGVLEFHEANLRQDELLAQTVHKVGGLRRDGRHRWSELNAATRGM